jgi:predicted GNAT family N-acyltransferase
MVKFIPYELTLALRSKILRNNLPLAECVFPTDQVAGAFHLGYDKGEEIATVASFFPQHYKDRKEPGYQLRGMATDHGFSGKGYGSQLIKFAISYIKNTNAQYIWCNARKSAVEFYEKLGFVKVSAEFDVPGIGPHYEMILNLY